MKIKNFLTEKFATAMVELGIPSDCQPSIALSSRPEFGDYQVNGAMKAAKKMDSKPRDLAALIIEKVELSEAVDRLEIAGPGFINIFLSAKFLAKEISKPLVSKLPQKSIKNRFQDAYTC